MLQFYQNWWHFHIKRRRKSGSESFCKEFSCIFFLNSLLCLFFPNLDYLVVRSKKQSDFFVSPYLLLCEGLAPLGLFSVFAKHHRARRNWPLLFLDIPKNGLHGVVGFVLAVHSSKKSPAKTKCHSETLPGWGTVLCLSGKTGSKLGTGPYLPLVERGH